MNYADIKYPDIQDGEGIRVSLYVSGCHFHCKECHNKEAWDFQYGKQFTDETIEYILKILKKPYVQGLSLLGGEPLEPVNQQGILPLLRKVKNEFPEKDIWCWTGYRFDEDILGKMYQENDVTKEVLKYIDIMIDGQFEIDNKVTDLAFRGSTNQRKIDVQKSIQKGEMVRLKFGDEYRYETSKPKVIYFKEFNKQDENLKETASDSKIPANFNNIEIFQPADSIEHKIEIQKETEIIAAKNID